jgi:hypothetical protein
MVVAAVVRRREFALAVDRAAELAAHMTSVSSSRPRRFRSRISAPAAVDRPHCARISFGRLPCCVPAAHVELDEAHSALGRRRASRQFAANVPGFFTSSPYIASVASSSPEKSTRSGTDICMRNAISACAMRARTSGSSVRSELVAVEFATRSSMRRRSVARDALRIAQEQHRIAAARSLQPWCSLGRKPLPQKRADSACMLPKPLRDQHDERRQVRFMLPRP